MKLKTLKDLEWSDEGMIAEWELKAEVIKWVKVLLNDTKEVDGGYPGFTGFMLSDSKTKHKQAIRWIKHFFNITEEDLK